MFTGAAVTLDAWVLAGLLMCAAGLGAVGAHGIRSIRRRLHDAREKRRAQHTLAELFRKDEFNREIDDVSERATPRTPGDTDTILRARVDHLRQVQQIWGPGTRQNAMEQVAAIMKRSVRSGEDGRAADVIDEVDGDGFSILVRGAEEQDASLIAKRLRRELARTRIEGLSGNVRLTASFGVASRRMGEGLAQWRARAESALSAASAKGEDHIVEASEIEEVKLLAPPSPTADPKAA